MSGGGRRVRGAERRSPTSQLGGARSHIALSPPPLSPPWRPRRRRASFPGAPPRASPARRSSGRLRSRPRSPCGGSVSVRCGAREGGRPRSPCGGSRESAAAAPPPQRCVFVRAPLRHTGSGLSSRFSSLLPNFAVRACGPHAVSHSPLSPLSLINHNDLPSALGLPDSWISEHAMVALHVWMFHNRFKASAAAAATTAATRARAAPLAPQQPTFLLLFHTPAPSPWSRASIPRPRSSLRAGGLQRARRLQRPPHAGAAV
jgi:hypothetical protein